MTVENSGVEYSDISLYYFCLCILRFATFGIVQFTSLLFLAIFVPYIYSFLNIIMLHCTYRPIFIVPTPATVLWTFHKGTCTVVYSVYSIRIVSCNKEICLCIALTYYDVVQKFCNTLYWDKITYENLFICGKKNNYKA